MILDDDKLVAFWGPQDKNGIFSQWYESDMIIRGDRYFCCEQWMMYRKAILFQDYEIADKILKSRNPREIKALGRKVKNFNQAIWDENKENIVFEGNYEKFTQSSYLYGSLMNTVGKIIVEASPYDRIWGIGLSMQDDRIYDTSKWQGKNLLGNAIMEVRSSLIQDLRDQVE